MILVIMSFSVLTGCKGKKQAYEKKITYVRYYDQTNSANYIDVKSSAKKLKARLYEDIEIGKVNISSSWITYSGTYKKGSTLSAKYKVMWLNSPVNVKVWFNVPTSGTKTAVNFETW